MAGEPQARRLFGREMRLKLGRDFARVRREGRRMACGCFIANWQALPAGGGAGLGGINAEKLGKAVGARPGWGWVGGAFRSPPPALWVTVALSLVATRT